MQPYILSPVMLRLSPFFSVSLRPSPAPGQVVSVDIRWSPSVYVSCWLRASRIDMPVSVFLRFSPFFSVRRWWCLPVSSMYGGGSHKCIIA